MIIKIIIVVVMLAILFSLFRALFFLVKDQDKENSKRTVNSLSWRIGLSIVLFLLLMLAIYMGWVTPHSLDGKPLG